MKPTRVLTALLLAPLASLQAADEEAAPAYEQLLKIDVHSHVFEDFPALNDLFRRINMRTVNICVPAGDGHLEQMHRVANELSRKYPELYPFIATFDVRGHAQPDYAEKAIAWLDGQFALGAVGVKIWKEVGMEIKDQNGKYVLPDDPRFDPIYLPTPEQHQLGGYKTWLGTNVMQEDTSVIPTKNLMELLAELKKAE